MVGRKLAIAIPTYCRADILVENIERMLDEAQVLGVAIYVSDDSPDSTTEERILPLARRYPDIHYRRNTPALGHDENLVQTLVWPDTEYVWLLGDALWVKPGFLSEVLKFLTNQDLLFVNSHSDDRRMIGGVDGEEARILLRESLWHQTLTGATIYRRDVRNWLLKERGKTPLVRNFPQLSVMLGFASANDARIGWFGRKSIGLAPKKSYWSDRALSVFIDDWAALVTSFPQVIAPKDFGKIIKTHSANTKLFNWTALIDLKEKGLLSWKVVRSRYFFAAMHLSRWKVIAILVLPTVMLKLAASVRSSSRNLVRHGSD